MSDYNIEQAIRNASVPIASNETEEVNALGYHGVLLNRAQVQGWNGPVPINQYKLNNDPNPEVITKVSGQPVEYNQDIQVRYLRPPTPAPHGDIIIKEQQGTLLPPAPPLIIRQHAPTPITPETLIVREHPPAPPQSFPTKIITIPGKVYEPPPRKVIIEKLAPLPAKPQSIVIERWLPFKSSPRRVIFEGAQHHHQENVRNLIVNWQTPQATIKKKISYLGTVEADPRDYIAKYGTFLKRSNELPSFVGELERLPQEADHSNKLIGDLDALRYLDLATLEREGLGMYGHYLTGASASTFASNIASTIASKVEPHSHAANVICNSCGLAKQVFQY